MVDSPNIPHLDAGESYRELRAELDAAYHRVMEGGCYILGQELEAFEAEYAAYCGVRHCAGTANGLEALQMILAASGIGAGDEVIVPGHTFIATWLAVSHCGATPVAVDADPYTRNLNPNLLEASITSRTKAIIAVHLYGRPAPMREIHAVAANHRLPVFEDAAQAHGAILDASLASGSRRAGALSTAAAFSFYPGKNLGAFGDAGAIVTNDAALLDRVRALRNYGGPSKYLHLEKGFNSRLDPLQAAFLRVKLRHLDRWNDRRRAVADFYLREMSNCRHCELPAPPEDGMQPVWHQFVITHPRREVLQQRLSAAGIGTAIHYPVPPHLSPAYQDAGYRSGSLPVTERLAETVLSLPMGPHLSDESAARVAAAVADLENAGYAGE